MFDRFLQLVRINDDEVEVTIPVPTIRLGTKTRDIYKEEEYYIERRDEASFQKHKPMFDRVRATLKYASSCGGTLVKEIQTEPAGRGYQAVIDIQFHSKEATDEFMKDANFAIGEAIMD